MKKHLKKIESDDEWDREIEADAKAGRLDDLWEQALDDIKRVEPNLSMQSSTLWPS